jgi:transposase
MKENKDGRSINRVALEEFRLRAMFLRQKRGYSVGKISEIFGIHYNSVSRWFVKYRKGGEGNLYLKKAKGAAPILNLDNIQFLEKSLTYPATDFGFQTPLWTSTYIRILLKKNRDISLNRTTIWRYLVKLGFSFQKPEKRYTQQDQDKVNIWIKKQWPKIKRWALENRAILYFEDESGISLAPVIGKTWAPKGKTPIVRVTGSRGGVLAMSAISPSGRMCFKLEKRRINSDVMIEFLKEIGACHFRRKVGVIMDQAPCHVSKKVRNFSEDSKQIKVFYIPPYSPELNPDEKVWRHLKHVELKDRQSQNKKGLAKEVVKALRKIQKKKLAKNFCANYLT